MSAAAHGYPISDSAVPDITELAACSAGYPAGEIDARGEILQRIQDPISGDYPAEHIGGRIAFWNGVPVEC